MTFLEPHYWPLWICVGLLIFANVWNQATTRVPNWLTVTTLAAGMTVALALSLFPGILPRVNGGLGSAVIAVLVGAACALGLWFMANAPGGCVKMHIAFCAWIGCGLSSGGSAALLSSLGAAIFGVFAAIIVRWMHQESYDENSNRRPVLHLQPFTSLGAVA